jgi:hypothetical protein
MGMPLFKSKKKSAMSENIKTEMAAGKPQKQAVAIAYDVMRRARKKKMAQGGLTDPEHPKDEMESSIETYFPTYDNREGDNPEGYSSTQPEKDKVSMEGVPRSYSIGGRVYHLAEDQESLQERMTDKPNDKEDRDNVLFDGKAERIDPLDKELKEKEDHVYSHDEDEDDENSIVSRIMKKIRAR